ncbi:hypothetical protein [Thermodesulforhabdus norvegica]|nr:hypothetical protein [Thermodesulforhabdus norvegica]
MDVRASIDPSESLVRCLRDWLDRLQYMHRDIAALWGGGEGRVYCWRQYFPPAADDIELAFDEDATPFVPLNDEEVTLAA